MTGIYVGDGKVIHFTTGGQAVGTVSSSSSSTSLQRYPTCGCTEPQEARGVVISCLNCFLAGDDLHRYEYGVSPAFFVAKFRGGTCTIAASDKDDIVVHRAKYLLKHGFRRYDVFKNNCENFAVYCKTGLVDRNGTIGHSGQAAFFESGPHPAISFLGLPAILGAYCATRCATDIGLRKDMVKVEVEELVAKLQ